MPLSLPTDATRQLVESIQVYFRDERDEEIGELRASLLLEFILEEIGPSVYNQALRDAQAHLRRTVDDLDVTLAQTELAHSAALRTRKNSR
ncbi:MAG: hypothetical protein Rubg2KO_33540 [Rubricoccaceae bacterium]